MAAYFSEELVGEVVQANDIVDIVSGYVRLKRSGNSYMGCCPFHREKTPSFHVSADKQLYHCFGCGAGGSVLQFVMNAEGLDFSDALRYLADRAGIRLPDGEAGGRDEEKYKKKQKMFEMNRDAARFFRECLLSPSGAKAQEYLTGRKLTGKTIAAFGLGYAPPLWDGLLKHLREKGYDRSLMVEAGLCIMNDKGHVYDRFRDRVMFPIIDPRGNIVGFTGRILSGDGAKYMNSPESIAFDKGKNLYALNLAKKSTRGYYILTEGNMDVISLHQAGINAAIASCGTAFTREQARLIAKSPVYLCFDSDSAGQKAISRAAEIFKEFDTALKVIEMADVKDPDDFIKKYGAEEFEKLIQNAKTLTEYRMDLLLKGVDLNNTAQKIEMLGNAAKLFSEISSAVEREVYIARLSAKTGISADSINSEVRKANAKNVRKQVSGELRKAVGGTQGEIRQASKRKTIAEAGFLAMLSESEKVYLRLGDKFSEESFCEEIHKKIFSHICTYYNEKKPGLCREYLFSEMAGFEKEISNVLMSVQNVSDPIKAAEDFAQAIEDEIFNEKLQKAQADGDVALISELLKSRKQKG
ncbi:MAG: DNA primase [Clostridia bacterium]|nr:DNA primase [Clostridia bacterium]